MLKMAPNDTPTIIPDSMTPTPSPQVQIQFLQDGSVIGPDNQHCETERVLEKVLNRYTHITTNKYRWGATGRVQSDFMLCDCKYSDSNMDKCGMKSNCINREMQMECEINNCSTGSYCDNQKIQRNSTPKLQVFQTTNKDLGIRTLEDLDEKTFVIEYCGEVLPSHMFEKRSIEYSENGSKHFYFMSLANNEYIDATRKGNISRFLNHSCDPNCVLQKWIVGNRMVIGIFTKRQVKMGEELTFDYQFERYGSKAQICHCGTSVCTGYIGKDKEETGTRSLEQLDLLSDEDEDEISETRNKKRTKKVETVEDIKEIVKYLMVNSQDSTKILKGIRKLLSLEGNGLLRKFVHFRGLSILLKCLNNHIDSKDFVRYNILNAIKLIPVSTKNAVQQLEPVIEQLTSEEYGQDTSRVAKEILQSWKDLEIIYKIPKKEISEIQSEKKQKLDDGRSEPTQDPLISAREGSLPLSETSNSYITRKLSPTHHHLKRSWSFAINRTESNQSTPYDTNESTVSDTSSKNISIADLIEQARLATEKKELEAAQQAKKQQILAKKEEKEAKLNFQKLKEKQKLAAVKNLDTTKCGKVVLKELSAEERQRIKADVRLY